MKKLVATTLIGALLVGSAFTAAVAAPSIRAAASVDEAEGALPTAALLALFALVATSTIVAIESSETDAPPASA